jgi:hypothetical protein
VEKTFCPEKKLSPNQMESFKVFLSEAFVGFPHFQNQKTSQFQDKRYLFTVVMMLINHQQGAF